MKNYLTAGMIALSALFVTDAMACQRVNANGGVGYVNVREHPDLNARVVTQWNNPEFGSDWGSAYYCGQEYVDYDGRTWSYIEMDMKDGSHVGGWVSDKVLMFLPE
jgi:hypothetical protein